MKPTRSPFLTRPTLRGLMLTVAITGVTYEAAKWWKLSIASRQKAALQAYYREEWREQEFHMRNEARLHGAKDK